jgi:Methylmalonyl-CoA mutase
MSMHITLIICTCYVCVYVCMYIQILQEETQIKHVADPWGGSYMMEALTEEVCAGALEVQLLLPKPLQQYLLHHKHLHTL